MLMCPYMKTNYCQTTRLGETKTDDSSGIRNKFSSVLSGVFARGTFLSLLVLLLMGLTAETKANVIQANNTYPPPNGSFQSPGPDYNFGSGVTAVQFTNVAFAFFDSFVLVAGPVPTLSFNAQFSYYLSTDGGSTWSGEQAATAHFVVALGTPTGNSYPFQITSLTINGGDLPPGFQLQFVGPMPGTPVATFTPSGSFVSIDTTFYLPLQLSQDGGASWTANSVSGSFGTPAFVLSPLTSEEISHSPTLPPGDGQYYTADQYHAAFASGIIIRNPIHSSFLGQSCSSTNGPTRQTNSLCPPPILNGTSTEDFTSQMNFDIDMPATTHIAIGASVETRVTHMQDFGTFQIYKTQMINLDPNPGSLPAGMNFRINPDPNKPSLGITTMRPGASANETNICSAFALRLQMTTDNGVTWQDSTQFTRMNLRILPVIFISHIGNNAILQWQNNFTLQSTTNLLVPFANVPGPIITGPYTNPISGTAKFFRLVGYSGGWDKIDNFTLLTNGPINNQGGWQNPENADTTGMVPLRVYTAPSDGNKLVSFDGFAAYLGGLAGKNLGNDSIQLNQKETLFFRFYIDPAANTPVANFNGDVSSMDNNVGLSDKGIRDVIDLSTNDSGPAIHIIRDDAGNLGLIRPIDLRAVNGPAAMGLTPSGYSYVSDAVNGDPSGLAVGKVYTVWIDIQNLPSNVTGGVGSGGTQNGGDLYSVWIQREDWPSRTNLFTGFVSGRDESSPDTHFPQTETLGTLFLCANNLVQEQGTNMVRFDDFYITTSGIGSLIAPPPAHSFVAP